MEFSVNMAALKVGRVVLLTLSIVLTTADESKYSIPAVTIQAFTPKGFRASIPGVPNQSLFAFQGNVNRKIASNQVGAISGEVLSPSSDGRWVFDSPDVKLKTGDVIDYHVFAAIDRVGYVQDNLQFTVKELEPYVALTGGTKPAVTSAPPAPTSTTSAPAQGCEPTLTRLRTGTACAGQTVFEEHFNSLRDSVWQVEHYIPLDHPELPFVSYQKSAVTVKDGHLRIAAALQQTQQGFSNESIYSGSLNLIQGCTSIAQGACQTQAEGANILPPVVSGRVISRPGFAFTYGTVSVRAKLPKGDWLYPEILLEPFLKKFGSGPLNFKSGVLKIACACGNRELLEDGGANHGNRYLYGGPIIDSKCRESLIRKKEGYSNWGNDFHVYSVKWTPDRMTFLVDDVDWFFVEPAANGLRGKLPPACATDSQPGMAPFDDHFYLTLGLAAGGVTEFRDHIFTTDNSRKPWTNRQSKAALNFWRHLDSWYPTWEQPALLVDYVKVVAL